jgi:hypothetical protein
LKDELEEEDEVGFIALHSTAEILYYWIFLYSNLFHPVGLNCNVQYLYLKSETCNIPWLDIYL